MDCSLLGSSSVIEFSGRSTEVGTHSLLRDISGPWVEPGPRLGGFFVRYIQNLGILTRLVLSDLIYLNA